MSAMASRTSETAPVPSFPIDEIPALVARLRETFDSGRTRPLTWRRQQLQGLLAFASDHSDRLVEALQADMGKPELEARAADLGGNALALMSGDLTDAETALGICTERAGDHVLARTLLPWLDPNLRQLLDQGTHFSQCPAFEPASAEHLEEVACSWDG